MGIRLNDTVHILDKPHGHHDGTEWTVWSRSPTGWHLFRRLPDDSIVWKDIPTRLLTTANRKMTRSQP